MKGKEMDRACSMHARDQMLTILQFQKLKGTDLGELGIGESRSSRNRV
jgi:hypothetical protein